MHDKEPPFPRLDHPDVTGLHGEIQIYADAYFPKLYGLLPDLHQFSQDHGLHTTWIIQHVTEFDPPDITPETTEDLTEAYTKFFLYLH